jgi:hypothetical protein
MEGKVHDKNASSKFFQMTLLEAPGFTRLATGDLKGSSVLQPESGGNRGNTGSHLFRSP